MKRSLLIICLLTISKFIFCQILVDVPPKNLNRTDSLVISYTSLISAEYYILSGINKLDRALHRTASYRFPDSDDSYYKDEFKSAKKMLAGLSETTDPAYQNYKSVIATLEYSIGLTESCHHMQKSMYRTEAMADHFRTSKCEGYYFAYGEKIQCVNHTDDGANELKRTQQINEWKGILQSLMKNISEMKVDVAGMIGHCNKN